uniref:Uncharacterized protein n=1 Tax=viral metagenome TaxID=1070528 RepID=A0A6M3JTL5_9ZZZZ
MAKKMFAVVALMIIVAFPVYADEDGQLAPRQDEFYEAISPDNTIEDILDIEVYRYTPLTYTMRGCDYQIARFRLIIMEAEDMIETWQGIRALLEVEAKKVKLKTKNTKEM